MKEILFLLGWKYVKNNIDGTYHHYKCEKLRGNRNTKTYTMNGMVNDLVKNPYMVSVGKCLEVNV